MNFRGAETVEFSPPFQHRITEDVSFQIKLRIKKIHLFLEKKNRVSREKEMYYPFCSLVGYLVLCHMDWRAGWGKL